MDKKAISTESKTNRRTFLKRLAGTAGLAAITAGGLTATGMGGVWLARKFRGSDGSPASPHSPVPDDLMSTAAFGYLSNPSLRTLHSSWLGTPLDEQGRFRNHEFPFIQGFDSLLKWKLGKNPQAEQKRSDPWLIRVESADRTVEKAQDMVVPLGHASFFIQLAGRRLLIDPVFFDLPGGLKRTSRLPLDPERLREINYVLVSHAHYDHCDRRSLALLMRNNPQAQVLTGLKMESLLSSWAPGVRVQEAGWYQGYDLADSLEIIYVPTRHWSNRFPWDVNRRLWGGFLIRGAGRSIYFNGDSGYGSHYRELSDQFGPVDLALLGAGAYSPRWFMQASHQDPQQALQAFQDLRAERLLPFHYGTFDLSDEPPSEPETILREESGNRGLGDRLELPVLGRPVEI